METSGHGEPVQELVRVSPKRIESQHVELTHRRGVGMLCRRGKPFDERECWKIGERSKDRERSSGGNEWARRTGSRS